MNFHLLNLSSLPTEEDLLKHPEATIFHTPAWARVLHESYGCEPAYFAVFNNNSLRALLPIMNVRSCLTGRRGVSLPFTDYCSPILACSTNLHQIFSALEEHGKKAGWSYIELRGTEAPTNTAIPSATFYCHKLDLNKGEQSIRSSLRSSTWRNIKKAQSSGVQVSLETTIDALREFYRLNCLTRRSHGLPPQPEVFFNKLHEHIISKDMGVIASASYKGKVISSGVYLRFSDCAIYKYGASDRRYQHLRSNNLVMWEAIRWAIGKGCQTLCMGRTEPDHKGLLQFKRGWGTEEEILRYYKYDLRVNRFVQQKSRTSGLHNAVFRAMPSPILRLAGQLLYPHIA